MQAEQAVTLQMYEESHFPWFTNLFVLYLLAVLIITLVAVVRIALNLVRLRRLEKSRTNARSDFQEVWTNARARIDFFKTISTVTLLLALADLTLALIDILRGTLTEKVLKASSIAGRTADALVPFASAIFICVALHICAAFFNGMLSRRMFKFEMSERSADRGETSASR